MKKFGLIFIFLLLVLSISHSQQVLRLVPYDGNASTFLNAQFAADTTATNGLLPGRVYELDRDGYYLQNAIITIGSGDTLRFRAAAGTGKLPVVFLWETGTGGTPTRPPGNMVVLNGATLEMTSICVAGYYEPEPERVGGVQGGLINTTAVGNSIILDSVVLSNINGQLVRVGNNSVKVKVTNSIFANMGALSTSNLGAGKGLDLREAAIDSFIIENTTFVNYQDRAIRHYNFAAPTTPTGALKYCRINHNSFINGMGFHGLLSLGSVGKNAIITNNFFMDGFSMGEDPTDTTRAAEWANTGETYPSGRNRITWIFTTPNDSTIWTISNNYFAISDSGKAFLDDFGFEIGSPLSYHINKRLGADSVKAFKQVDVSMQNIPRLMTNMMRWYEDPNGGGRIKSQTNFVLARDDFDRRSIEWYRDTLNAKIKATPTMLAKLLSSDGKVVGDPRWGAPTVVADPSALITVDGDKDAFYGTLTGPLDGYLQLRSSAFNNNGAPKDDADLSAKVWTAWDDTWFYFYAEVMDDTISANGVNSYQDDGLELKFDAQAKDSVANSIFGVNLTILGGAGSDSLLGIPNNQKQWARKTITGGYALELALNWPAIGTTEKVSVGVDSVFGLAINFHDNDGNLAIGGGRQASVQWAAVMDDAVWNTPKYLGTVMFLSGNKLLFDDKNNMTGRSNPYKYDGTDIPLSVKLPGLGIPTVYSVGQNYPNPFNPATTIKYQLPVSGVVMLKVYNFIGQEVATLVNTHQDAAFYSVTFNASKLASGVYFYTLRSGSFVQTKKMLLIK